MTMGEGEPYYSSNYNENRSGWGAESAAVPYGSNSSSSSSSSGSSSSTGQRLTEMSCQVSSDCGEGYDCESNFCVRTSVCDTPHCEEPLIDNVNTGSCLTVSPTNLAFGAVNRGAPEVREVTLSACANSAVTINSIRSLDVHPSFTYDHPDLPLRLNPNEVARLYVTYTPDTVGLNNGTIEIMSDDSQNSVQQINLSGEARPPAIADAGLHLRLEWDSDGDIDLHLLAPGGQIWESTDCHWTNLAPEWGDPNDNLDNPFLDVDNTQGYGPENININHPQPGVYKILIHYFSSGFYGDHPINSTVTVMSYGQQIGVLGPKQLNAADDLWIAAEIEFPSAQLRIIDQVTFDQF